MALFEWKAEHSVSIVRFDSDHKKLFALLSELNDAMAERRGRFAVVRILQELSDYARRHFAAEENAMRRAKFPGLEEHIAEHREFAASIDKYYAEYTADNGAIPIDVLYFLRDWLQRHILQTDRKYGETLNRAGMY